MRADSELMVITKAKDMVLYLVTIFTASVGLQRRRLKPLSLLRRQLPSQGRLGVQQPLQKPSPEGNHDVSEKVGESRIG